MGNMNTFGQIPAHRTELVTEASKPSLVVSIDFGTSYSGWAFSFLQEIEAWGYNGTEKTPTVVLVRPESKTLQAFGYDAEKRYMFLSEEGRHRAYYYFKGFKMILHKALGEKLNRGIKVKDEMGMSLLAMDVFSMAIKFLVKNAYETWNKRKTGSMESTEVHWVLTVPAIWTDSAKQFMREAAEKAGIPSEQLSLALEPEAASLFCRYPSLVETTNKSDVSIATFPTKARYMILDAGSVNNLSLYLPKSVALCKTVLRCEDDNVKIYKTYD